MAGLCDLVVFGNTLEWVRHFGGEVESVNTSPVRLSREAVNTSLSN